MQMKCVIIHKLCFGKASQKQQEQFTTKNFFMVLYGRYMTHLIQCLRCQVLLNWPKCLKLSNRSLIFAPSARRSPYLSFNEIEMDNTPRKGDEVFSGTETTFHSVEVCYNNCVHLTVIINVNECGNLSSSKVLSFKQL